jgi:hypothetical protein
MTVPIVTYARKHFYLIQAINERIESLKGSGLIEYWYSLQFLKVFTKEQKSPEILTLHHLSGSFEIWAGGCAVSFVIFAIERVFYNWKGCCRCF